MLDRVQIFLFGMCCKAAVVDTHALDDGHGFDGHGFDGHEVIRRMLSPRFQGTWVRLATAILAIYFIDATP